MTSGKPNWKVELTRSAQRDLKRFRGEAFRRTIQELDRLGTDPMLGQPLTGSMLGVRSLHFSLPGSGQHRAAYLCLTDEQVCLVFAVGSRENFYREAERRWKAFQAE
jgi:mRNA-degrading endonuclease RelE of RelBE toxin-antitoxin system